MKCAEFFILINEKIKVVANIVFEELSLENVLKYVLMQKYYSMFVIFQRWSYRRF